jgi:hypothetical protein
MFSDSGTTVVRKPYSFLAVTALGISAVLVTAIVSGVGLGAYALRIVEKKSDSLVGLVEQTVRSLPEIRASLPPALADTLDDVRQPEYREALHITVKEGAKSDRHGGRRIGIVVENTGDKMISLLSMRLVGSDADGAPVLEKNIWAASPIQIDNDWRGPLMPHETRRLVVYCHDADRAASYSSEVTEVRVWQGDKKSGPQTKPASANVEESAETADDEEA